MQDLFWWLNRSMSVDNILLHNWCTTVSRMLLEMLPLQSSSLFDMMSALEVLVWLVYPLNLDQWCSFSTIEQSHLPLLMEPISSRGLMYWSMTFTTCSILCIDLSLTFTFCYSSLLTFLTEVEEKGMMWIVIGNWIGLLAISSLRSFRDI